MPVVTGLSATVIWLQASNFHDTHIRLQPLQGKAEGNKRAPVKLTTNCLTQVALQVSLCHQMLLELASAKRKTVL